MVAGYSKLLKSLVCLGSSFAALNWFLEYVGMGWSSWGLGAAVPGLNVLVAYVMGAVGVVGLLWWVQHSVLGKGSC